MQSKADIGFGKKVRAAWLDSALDHAAAGQSFDEVKQVLAKEIAANNPGPEAIRKVQAALRRVWFNPPEYCQALRDDAIRLFQRDSSPNTRFVLHWGMVIAAYPFVGSVAEAFGRLLKLQSEVRRTDVDRRIREQHGDRAFVIRIARIDVSSFLDWGVITEATKKGVYLPGKQVRLASAEQLAWLVEAVLVSRDKPQMAVSEFCQHPVLFPVNMGAISTHAVRSNPRLRVERQSLNEEFVFLESAKPR